MKLTGKRAIITGAGRGIGAAMAHRLSADGCAVAVADISMSAAEATAREIIQNGGQALAVQVDVADSKSVQATIDCVVKAFGGLEILVNNAGIVHSQDTSIEETPESAWDLTLAVNLKSVFLTIKAALPALEASGNGAIINVASIVGFMGSFPSQIAYTASKGGLIALNRELGVALARRGVRVNAVAPGLTATPMADQLFDSDAAFELRRTHIPMGRMARPEEIASVVAFLASDDSSYMTAHVVPVDGGLVSAYLTPPD